MALPMKAGRTRPGMSGIAILLVVVGLLVFWNNIGGWDPRSLFHLLITYWPCAFISIGVSNVFLNARKRMAPGIAFLLLGTLLQLLILDWLPGDIGDYWPVMFLMAGLWMLLVRPGDTVFGFEQHAEAAFEIDEMFGSRSVRLLSKALTGGTATATLASITLECGDALPAASAVVLFDVLLSTVHLLVPLEWRVLTEADTTLASVRDKRKRSPDTAPDSPLLILRGTLTLSTLEVKAPSRKFGKGKRSTAAGK